MLRCLLAPYAFQLRTAHRLLEGIPEDRRAEQVNGCVNHPAWVMGHLCLNCDWTGSLIGLEPGLSAQWKKLFTSGSQPTDDAEAYPTLAELLAYFDDAHHRIHEAVSHMPEYKLEATSPYEKMRDAFPTLGAVLVHAMVGHESLHLGQLSAWRRAAGLPSGELVSA